MIERNVNIFWHPNEDEPTGHISVFRPLDSSHEADLMQPDEFSEKIVAESSPFACPVEPDLSRSKFCEKYGTVPTWIGMKRGQKE